MDGLLGIGGKRPNTNTSNLKKSNLIAPLLAEKIQPNNLFQNTPNFPVNFLELSTGFTYFWRKLPNH
jgi:hypothetical protein